MSTSGPSSTPDWLSGGRIPALDGLRAIAILLVVFAHVMQTNGMPALGSLRRLIVLGPLGVDIFFVLSGFLITTLLCREQDRTQCVSLRDFYIRRAYRILPAYCSYLGFIAVLQIFGCVIIPTRDWIAAGTFTMNFLRHPAWDIGHLWSLSIEEHFYFLWPISLAWLSRRSAVRLLFAALLLQPVIRWIVILKFPAWSPMTDLWTFTRFDSIASGSLFAILCREDTYRVRLDQLAGYWPVAIAMLVFGIVMGVVSSKIRVGVTPTTTAISVAILVWQASRTAPRFLESRLMRAIGLGSYSLYLWQQVFLNPHSSNDFARFPQNLILAGLAAGVSFHFIERPFLRLKERRHHKIDQNAGVAEVHRSDQKVGM